MGPNTPKPIYRWQRRPASVVVTIVLLGFLGVTCWSPSLRRRGFT